MSWLAWAWLRWRGSTTASSLASRPPGPTLSGCPRRPRGPPGEPDELERLRRFYPDHFAERPFGAVDVYVVLRDAPTAGTRPELLELAKNLARELARDTEVRDHVRRIACIAARTGTEPVRFDARFAYGAGCPDRA